MSRSVRIAVERADITKAFRAIFVAPVLPPATAPRAACLPGPALPCLALRCLASLAATLPATADCAPQPADAREIAGVHSHVGSVTKPLEFGTLPSRHTLALQQRAARPLSWPYSSLARPETAASALGILHRTPPARTDRDAQSQSAGVEDVEEGGRGSTRHHRGPSPGCSLSRLVEGDWRACHPSNFESNSCSLTPRCSR